MIQLAFKDLNANEKQILASLQKQIDLESDFKVKVETAKRLWATKGGAKGKEAFLNIKDVLKTMCVYVGVCNYCEQNEANDIEHIFPKAFFPESAFIWDNYLLACKQCNSAYKLDKCFVIDDNDNICEVMRKSIPAFKTGAFINPRAENPNDFLILNLQTFQFDLFPALSKKDKLKAEKTLEILELNKRDTLIAARKSASNYYYHRMHMLAQLLQCSNLEQMEEILTPHDDLLDKNLPIDEIKKILKMNFQKHLSFYQHPSVWYSIKMVESKINLKWKKIFEVIPEALTW